MTRRTDPGVEPMDRTAGIKAAIGSILERDLAALGREVAAFPDESQLWITLPGVPNSAGNLALHLAGNLQHFFGAVLGGTGYVRNRPAEFSRRNVPRVELLAEIEAARQAVRAALSRLSPDQLTAEYPETIGGSRVLTGEYLLHLLTHATYHLGQIDYLRRVITGSDQGVGAVRPADLGSARPAQVQA
jgi:uncharacterized damage-inducible protein DinB